MDGTENDCYCTCIPPPMDVTATEHYTGIARNVGMQYLQLAWTLEGLFCNNCKKHNAINMSTTMLV